MHETTATGRRIRRAGVALIVGALVAATLALATPGPVGAQATELHGVVASAGTGLDAYDVTLLAAGPAGGAPTVLGTATTDAVGAFTLPYATPADPSSVLYVTAANTAGLVDPGTRTLVSVLGTAPLPADVVVNERTTVAAAYAMAQFTRAGAIAGPTPGLPNAASMVPNLVVPATGELSPVLLTSPNGDDTSADETFRSLANALAACVADPLACDALLAATAAPGTPTPTTTFEALVNAAAFPWLDPAPLWAVTQLPPAPNAPARAVPPAAWTLALRFVGDGTSLDGPGNFALDHEGNLWVVVNYEFSKVPGQAVCDSKLLVKVLPDGSYAPGSPFTGGGLSGAGFGVGIDPFGDVWVGNYGFAAPVPECPEERQPPHNSLSRFTLGGIAVSPAEGYTQGGVSWPQGTVSDRQGNIWVANCGNDSVTIYPGGDPGRARQLTDIGLSKPFDIVHADDGTAFVTGTGNDTLGVFGPDGTPRADSPLTGDHLDKPMGIARDSQGNLWVANSGVVNLPCPQVTPSGADLGSVALLTPEGAPVHKTPIGGGGMTIPWGITTDGNDNVWVANFAGKRLSQLCGVTGVACPTGTTPGTTLSPGIAGYAFDGLVRNTGVQVDTAGNVWLANNWKEDAPVNLENPGGYELVAYLGLAGPVQPAAPVPRPPAPAPAPTPAPTPVVVRPAFTG